MGTVFLPQIKGKGGGGKLQIKNLRSNEKKGWYQEGTLPVTTYSPAYCQLDNTLYIIGGINLFFYAYDLVTGKTKTLPPPPVSGDRLAGAAAVCTIQNENQPVIFLYGGYTGEKRSNKLLSYAIETGIWEEMNDLPYEWSHGGYGMVDGKLIMAGGYTNNTITDTVYCYDLYGNHEWVQVASIPETSSLHSSIVYENELYIIGGQNYDSTDQKNALYKYNPSSDSWTTLTPMQKGRSGMNILLLGDKIYAVGGRIWEDDSLKPVNDVELYDFKADKWTNSLPLNIPNARAAIGEYKGTIHIIAGIDENGGVNTVQKFSSAWSVYGHMPEPLQNAAFGRVGSKFYLIGGSGSKKVRIYDFETQQWNQGTEVPDRTNEFSASTGVVVGTDIYVLGGYDTDYLNTLYKYSTLEDNWTQLPNMPEAKVYANAYHWEGSIYITGGSFSSSYPYFSDQSFVYNIATNSWSSFASFPEPVTAAITLAGYKGFGVIGGSLGNSGPSKDMYWYDIPSDSWKMLPFQLNEHRAYGIICNLNGGIYLIAGRDASLPGSNLKTYVCSTELMNDTTQTCDYKEAIPIPTCRAMYCIYDHELYVFGGYNGTLLNIIQKFSPGEAPLKKMTLSGHMQMVFDKEVTFNGERQAADTEFQATNGVLSFPVTNVSGSIKSQAGDVSIIDFGV